MRPVELTWHHTGHRAWALLYLSDVDGAVVGKQGTRELRAGQMLALAPGRAPRPPQSWL